MSPIIWKEILGCWVGTTVVMKRIDVPSVMDWRFGRNKEMEYWVQIWNRITLEWILRKLMLVEMWRGCVCVSVCVCVWVGLRDVRGRVGRIVKKICVWCVGESAQNCEEEVWVMCGRDLLELWRSCVCVMCEG
jgi:hypothetical protein